MSDRSPPARPEATFAHPVSLVAGLLIVALTLILVVLAAQPPPPKPVTAPTNEFSAGRAMALVERLAGDGRPHPVGSSANARVGARIVAELTALGYPVEKQTTFACRTEWAVCGEVTNILSRLPGETDDPAVLLTAHYDSVPAGPGAADDLAGVAVMLEVARIVRTEPPPRNPIVFLFSDGEEPGLLGAEAFVAEHPWAARVGIVVNLEANGTHGQSILFETTENNGWLIDAFAGHASRPVASSLYDQVYAFLPFNTDLTVYEAAGLPGINFAFTEEAPHYHTPLDAPANLEPGSVQHHGENALAAVRAFADRDLSNPPIGKTVYQDIAPGVVLRWPEPWTLWLALASLAVWLGVSAVLIRRGELPVRAVLWGLLVLPTGVSGATLLGLTLGTGIAFLTGVDAPWYAHPLPMRVALWSGAVLSLALVATAVARHAGFRGLLLGVWFWWSVLSVLVAWLSPDASVLFLLPTTLAASAVAVVAAVPFRTVPRVWESAALVALFGAAWLWVPLTRGSDYSAGDAHLGPALGFVVGMVASALAPLAALPVAYGRMRRWLLVGAGLVMTAAVIAALRVPAYSESRPQRLNLLHVEDRHSGQAFWAIDSPWLSDNSAANVPETLRRAGRFGAEPTTVLPWSSRRYLVAPIADTAAPAPAIDLRAVDGVAGERVLRLRLRSSRNATGVSLYVPRAAGLRRIAVMGTPYAMEEIPIEDGYQRFLCVTPVCDGLAVALHLESDAPATAFLVEATPGLPQGSDVLTAARPDTAVPSGSGDSTLNIDHVVLNAP